MTTVNDLHAWLESAGGHVYVAQCGGYQQALNALIAEDAQTSAAAYDLNRERERSGLPPLGRAAAATAVRPTGGPALDGTASAIRDRFRDPNWRVKVTTDDTADNPVRLDDRSAAMTNAVRAARGLDPL